MPAPVDNISASRPPRATGTEDERASRVYRALVFIERNLGNRLDVAEAARAACYAPRHFRRVFREYVGEGAHDYIRRLRLTRAATLLRLTPLSVTEVALATGFESVAGFNRAFAAQFGQTPSHYRTHCPNDEPAMPSPEPIAVSIEEAPPRRLAFLRHFGHEFGAVRTWMRLAAWARKRSLLGDDALILGIAHDDYDVPPARRRYDACVAIPPEFDPGPGIGVTKLPGGLVARHHFRGSLAALEQRWLLFVRHWLPDSGCALRLPYGYDVYPPRLLRPLALARLLLPGGTVEATLCLPVAPAAPGRVVSPGFDG